MQLVKKTTPSLTVQLLDSVLQERFHKIPEIKSIDIYQKGQLEETLTEEGYNDIAYNCAKEFVEEKGPTLTRKRIPPKNR